MSLWNWWARRKRAKHRRLCREEDKAIERLINWGATSVPPSPIQEQEGTSMAVYGHPNVVMFEEDSFTASQVEQALMGTQKKLDKDTKV